MLGPVTYGAIKANPADPVKQLLRPISNRTANQWTEFQGNGDNQTWDELDEGVEDLEGNPIHDGDTTSWISQLGGVGTYVLSNNISPGVDPGTRVGHKLRYAIRESDVVGSDGLFIRAVMEASNPSGSIGPISVAIDGGTDYKVYEAQVPAAGMDNIQNYEEISIGLESYSPNGTRRHILSAMELEVPPPGTGFFTSLTQELKGLWGMEEDELSDRLDSSGNGLHLTPNSPLSAITGLQGNAVDLGGGTPPDHLTHTGHADFAPTGDWTYMITFYTPSVVSEAYILTAPGEQLTLFTDDNRRLRVAVPGGVYTSPNNLLPLSTWVTAFLWYEKAVHQVYLQFNSRITSNEPIRVTPPGSFTWNASQPFRLGTFRPTSVPRPFIGRIDTTALWHRILSLQERQWLYNNGTGRSVAEILAN